MFKDFIGLILISLLVMIITLVLLLSVVKEIDVYNQQNTEIKKGYYD